MCLFLILKTCTCEKTRTHKTTFLQAAGNFKFLQSNSVAIHFCENQNILLPFEGNPADCLQRGCNTLAMKNGPLGPPTSFTILRYKQSNRAHISCKQMARQHQTNFSKIGANFKAWIFLGHIVGTVSTSFPVYELSFLGKRITR